MELTSRRCLHGPALDAPPGSARRDGRSSGSWETSIVCCRGTAGLPLCIVCIVCCVCVDCVFWCAVLTNRCGGSGDGSVAALRAPCAVCRASNRRRRRRSMRGANCLHVIFSLRAGSAAPPAGRCYQRVMPRPLSVDGSLLRGPERVVFRQTNSARGLDRV